MFKVIKTKKGSIAFSSKKKILKHLISDLYVHLFIWFIKHKLVP